MSRKIALLQWTVSLGFMAFLFYVASPKWQVFRCRAAQSEAKYRLEEIRNAQDLYLSRYQTYAKMDELRHKGWIKYKPIYYDFQDGETPTEVRYHVVAKGKADTLVVTDLWETTPHLPEARHTHDACTNAEQ
jgi:hypothetical protein